MIIMKKFFSFSILSAFLFIAITACGQQDKSKRPSPPAKVSANVGAATVSIDYSQPSLKGRTIGKDVEPRMDRFGERAPTKPLFLKPAKQ